MRSGAPGLDGIRIRARRKVLRIAAGLTLLAGSTHGQTRIYRPHQNFNLWSADTLYLGAGFTRLTDDPVRIRLRNNDAGFDGELYYLDPSTGNRVFLFSNHSPIGSTMDLTALVEVPKGVPLTFMYRVIGNGAWTKRILDAAVKEPKFTGSNRQDSPYRSAASSDGNVNPSLRFGHRWSVAGRVDAKVLEFGFEDDTDPTSDMDFDDIIFQVEGLYLVVFQKSARWRSYVW